MSDHDQHVHLDTGELERWARQLQAADQPPPRWAGHTYLVRYHSLSDGWCTVVVQAPDTGNARALAYREYGPPNQRAGVPAAEVQQLDGLPALQNEPGRGLVPGTVDGLIVG